jgi:hypothetical protein
MAFLDNSGDIILDAVLTETGRRRMAQGDFKITKFALGDDEIDYSLYNKNHPSGSAYYDLEILQTPVFEAFTQVNAGINYGLLPTSATDLLYLPVGKINELSAITTGTNAIASSGSSGIFVVSDSSNDSATTIGDTLTNATVDYIDGFNTGTGNFVLLETGLDTGASSTPVGSDANRQSLLVANGLVDTRFLVFYDTRFITNVYGLTAGSSFANNNSSNTLAASFSLEAGVRASFNSGLENYSSFVINGVKDAVVQTTSPNTETTYSVINGPRGSVAAVAPVIKSGLSAEYTFYGGTTTVGGTSVQFIDTTIYVQGVSSPAQIQIPVRIMRLA